MLDNRTRQNYIKNIGTYKGKIDGIFGNDSIAARDSLLTSKTLNIESWAEDRKMTALDQIILVKFYHEKVDGLIGEATRRAYENWQNTQRDITPTEAEIAHQPSSFPRQKDMMIYYGAPGTGHVIMNLPYPMRLAWDKSKVVNRINIHGKCAKSAERALANAFNHYGQTKIQALGLDLFGGCYNNRLMRGGSSLSTHAFACALDINPEQNQLRWGSDKAKMAHSDCKAFLDAFETQGWISLGRERNFDWMHIQAARL